MKGAHLEVRSLLLMRVIVDAHCDLAWNVLSFGRDYTRAADETRQLESGSRTVEVNDDTLLGWPEYQRGGVAIIFGTLFAAPSRRRESGWDKLCYANAQEAHSLYRQQVDLYRELDGSNTQEFRLILSQAGLEKHMAEWNEPNGDPRPVGIVMLMEGADGIRNVDELAEWHDLGLRIIGLAWAGTRFAGGTREPGPLSEEGRNLLAAMADLGFILDLSHMDEQAALEALDLYEGSIVASHVNCLSLLPGFPTNRHYSDTLLRKIIERGGIIGHMPVNNFLKTGWSVKNGSRREELSLRDFIDHIDHVCQLAGDSSHSGIGSDFDGGFGLQSVPPEIDTVADLQKLAPLLEGRGYSSEDIDRILANNWLGLLRRSLPG